MPAVIFSEDDDWMDEADEDWQSQYDNDPNPYEGTYSEE